MVAQRIERQLHLKKHLDPKGTLKARSILAKYYRLRKRGQLPDHEESPFESVFKNVSINRKGKSYIARFQQEIPKTITIEDYWKIYKEEVLKKVKGYPVSKVKFVMKIKMQRITLRDENPIEVISFKSEIFIVTKGMDVDDDFFDTLHRQIFSSVETFLKNGSGWTIVNLERFDINIYEYKLFAGSTYVNFTDIKVKFRGRK